MPGWYTSVFRSSTSNTTSIDQVTFKLNLTVSPENYGDWGAGDRAFSITSVSSDGLDGMSSRTAALVSQVTCDLYKLTTMRRTAAAVSVRQGKSIDWETDAELTLKAAIEVLTQSSQCSKMISWDFISSFTFASTPPEPTGSELEDATTSFNKIQRLTLGYTDWEQALMYYESQARSILRDKPIRLHKVEITPDGYRPEMPEDKMKGMTLELEAKLKSTGLSK